MRITLTSLAALLLGSSLGTAQQQNSNDSCGFILEGESSHPTITGPDELVPLVHVVGFRRVDGEFHWFLFPGQACLWQALGDEAYDSEGHRLEFSLAASAEILKGRA